MLESITPVILTYNEAQNIRRCLERLHWAEKIVVVDSGSVDGTLEILSDYPSVTLHHRPFDTHHKQWAFAINETGIDTPWILRLDADYQLTDELLEEIASLSTIADVAAYRIRFDYAIFGRRLLSSLYPANTILMRRGTFAIRDRGHTEAWDVCGAVRPLAGRIVHDDRKPVGAWLASQGRYMAREAVRLEAEPKGLRGWLRLHPPLAPIAMFIYCLFGKGLLLNGRAGLHYTLQRTTAEAVLSLTLLESRLRREECSRSRSLTL